MTAGPDLGGGPGGPGPRPPTIEGPPTKLLIFYFFVMNYFVLKLQCKILPPPPKKIWLLGGPQRGGVKKIFYARYHSPYVASPHKLWYNSTTASDPVVGWDGCPLPFLIPLDTFGVSILGALGASSLLLPTFQTKVTPLAGPRPPTS